MTTTKPSEPTLSELLLGRIRGEKGLSDDDLYQWLATLNRLKIPLIEPLPTLNLIRTTTRLLADNGLIVWEGVGWSRVAVKPNPPQKTLF